MDDLVSWKLANTFLSVVKPNCMCSGLKKIIMLCLGSSAAWTGEQWQWKEQDRSLGVNQLEWKLPHDGVTNRVALILGLITRLGGEFITLVLSVIDFLQKNSIHSPEKVTLRAAETVKILNNVLYNASLRKHSLLTLLKTGLQHWLTVNMCLCGKYKSKLRSFVVLGLMKSIGWFWKYLD